MTRAIALVLALVGVLGLAASRARAQSRPLVAPEAAAIYQRLLPRIARIKLFDHHAHPAFPDDPDVDIAPPPPGATMLRLRPENPETVAAARALFGFPFADMAGAHGKWLVDRKAALKRQYPGPAYFNYVLDRLGIETSMANRVAMPDYLDPARFKWVFFVDCFMFPFDNAGLAHRTPTAPSTCRCRRSCCSDTRSSSACRRRCRRRFASISHFLTRTLVENKRRGAVAMKFEASYFRSLSFADPEGEDRRADRPEIPWRRRAVSGGVQAVSGFRLPAPHHRCLDAEAARPHPHLGRRRRLLRLRGVNVLNLENVLRDPKLRGDDVRADPRRLSLRSGRRCCSRSMKNVYLDSSATELMLYPNEFKNVLRRWLEVYPEKLTFGTDAFPYNEALGVEEVYWMGVHKARTALAAALAETIAAREITEPQAMTIAQGYLHDNAASLYP